MKQIFYKGLLALTIAFGMTSCDKNELPDAPSVGVIVNDEYSKVSFEELGNGIVVPKLKGDEASKNAGEFMHIYSSTPQTLSIVDVDGASVYTGSYPANDISQINPASIILANKAGYIASSSNTSTIGLGVVSSFLPYTSTVAFDLSASRSIVLEATLDRGFLIVNVEDANEGARVQSATVQVGDGAKISLLDGGDGDYYGYLEDGTYNVDVTYLLDGNEVVQSSDDKVIVAGSAYTIELMLTDESPAEVGSITSTSTLDGTEAALSLNVDRADGGDINDDGDLLDTLVRIVTSIQATLDGEPTDAAPDVTSGPWSIVLDNDILVEVDSEESTEEAITTNINPDIDSDQYDTITRVVTTTTASVNGEPGTPDVDPGVWTILADYSSVFVDQNGDGVNDADQAGEDAVDTYSYSEWLPATAGVEFATVDQTRVATFNLMGDLDEPAVVAEDVTRTIANTAYVADEADEYTSVSTPITTGGDVSTIDSGDAVVTFLYGGGSYDSEAEAQAAADADASAAGTTVTIVRSSSQGRSIETTAIVVTTTTVYTVQINVREDATPLAPKADLVVPVTTPSSSVAGVAVVSTSDLSHNVDAADDGSSDAFVAGTITIAGYDNGWSVSSVTDAAGNAVVVSGRNFTSTVAGDYVIVGFSFLAGPTNDTEAIVSGDQTVTVGN